MWEGSLLWRMQHFFTNLSRLASIIAAFFYFVTYVDIFCTDDVGEEMAFYIYF